MWPTVSDGSKSTMIILRKNAVLSSTEDNVWLWTASDNFCNSSESNMPTSRSNWPGSELLFKALFFSFFRQLCSTAFCRNNRLKLSPSGWFLHLAPLCDSRLVTHLQVHPFRTAMKASAWTLWTSQFVSNVALLWESGGSESKQQNAKGKPVWVHDITQQFIILRVKIELVLMPTMILSFSSWWLR